MRNLGIGILLLIIIAIVLQNPDGSSQLTNIVPCWNGIEQFSRFEMPDAC